MSLDLDSSINLIFGENGSGKTSLLESVHFLATGRSYRGTKIDPLTKRGTDFCLVSATLQSPIDGLVSLGLQRPINGERTIKINGEKELRQSELARHLPSLSLGPDSVELLRGAPPERRKFLNQGVFHVEQSFTDIWRQAVRALQQRNNLLRNERSPDHEIKPWTEQLVRLGEQIDALRKSYFELFLPVFTDTYRFLLDLEGVKCSYKRGWDASESLEEVFDRQYESDRHRKFTQSGFQRADLSFTCDGLPVAQVCSRGELKLLAWSAILAQGFVLGRSDNKPVFLVDDLIAELDQKHQKLVAELLVEQRGQVLVTGTDRKLLEALWDKGFSKVFHVEQGSIRELEIGNE